MSDVTFNCRNCDQHLKIDAEARGWEVRCPNCGAAQTVPVEDDLATASQDAAADSSVQAGIPEFAARDPETELGFRYGAFISYRHVQPDRSVAKWLHAALESYRVPQRLARERGLPRRVGRIFRDEEELPASADLGGKIKEALQASRILVVICSRRTPESEWVYAEIARFRELGRDDQILAVLIDGDPEDSFPKALCEVATRTTDASGTPELQTELVEPLAADVRATGWLKRRSQKHIALLRLVAGIIGCPFDDLRMRDVVRAKKRRRVRLATAVALLTCTGLLVGGLIHENLDARKQRALARTEVERSEEARAKFEAQKQAISEWSRRFGARYGQMDDGAWASAVEAEMKRPSIRSDVARVSWSAMTPGSESALLVSRGRVIEGLPEVDIRAEEFTSIGAEHGMQPSPIEEELGALSGRFVMKGMLTCVRGTENETYVYMDAGRGPRNRTGMSARDRGRRRPPVAQGAPVVCVVFPTNVADRLAFLSQGDPVLAVARPFEGQTNGPVRSFLAPLKSPRTNLRTRYYCFRGEAVELEGKPLSFFKPDGVLFAETENPEELRRTPGSIYRNLPERAGETFVVTARLVKLKGKRGSLEAELGLSDTAEGRLTVRAMMGADVQLAELLDYEMGEAVEASLTLVEPDGGPSVSMSVVDSRMRAPESFTNAVVDPRFRWGQIDAECNWIRRLADEGSFVLATGPRRPMASLLTATNAVTPDMALAMPNGGVGETVTWDGQLWGLRVDDGVSILSIRLAKRGIATRDFEALSDDPMMPSKLADYVTGYLNPWMSVPGDKVSVTGKICAQDAFHVSSSGSAEVPRVRIETIQRRGDPKSVASPDRTRPPGSYRPITPAMVLGNPVGTAGRRVKWRGILEAVESRGGECHLRVSGKHNFEAMTRCEFALDGLSDYMSRRDRSPGYDEVLVEGVGAGEQEPLFRLEKKHALIELVSIARLHDSNSRFTARQPRYEHTLRRRRIRRGTLEWLGREVPVTSQQVRFEARFRKYDEKHGIVSLIPRMEVHWPRMILELPESAGTPFSSYMYGDPVTVEVAAGAWSPTTYGTMKAQGRIIADP